VVKEKEVYTFTGGKLILVFQQSIEIRLSTIQRKGRWVLVLLQWQLPVS
jgi:hypothetical protein